MYTSDLFQEITETVLLGPSAENALKRILMRLDGTIMKNDLYEEDDYDDEED